MPPPGLVEATKPVLTLDDAKRVALAAEAEARRNDWRVVIAVVDDGGHLLYLQRSHDTQFGSVETAICKARAAAAFHRPTKASEEAVLSGRTMLYLATVSAINCSARRELSRGAIIQAHDIAAEDVEDDILSTTIIKPHTLA